MMKRVGIRHCPNLESMRRDFAWSLEQYLASFDIEYIADFEAVRKKPIGRS